MKTYKGMTKKEIVEKLAFAKVEICKSENEKRFGDGLPRKNENVNTWRKFYNDYPMFSEKHHMFSLSAEYDQYCEFI